VLPSLVLKTLRDDRRTVAGWAVGLTAFVGLYVGFYPQFKGELVSAKMEALPAAMKQFMGVRDVATAAGYLEMTIYTLTGPLLLIMAAVVLGTRAVAGPEENRTLELMLANPISRPRFLLQRFGTLVAEVTVLGLIPWLVILGLAAAFDMGLTVARISAASLALLLMALLFGTVALAVGAAVGRRSAALAAGGGSAVVAYVLHGLSNQVPSLGWLRWLSPFHYYIGDDPLRTGFHAGSLLVPVAVTALLVAAGTRLFARRDLAN
jgi:ABC-2 type transport system permease protein